MITSSAVCLSKIAQCSHTVPSLMAASSRFLCSKVMPSVEPIIDKYKQAAAGSPEQQMVKKINDRREWIDAPCVYCDGSFEWNIKKGGIGIFWRPDDKRNASLSLTGPKLTNIRAELQAVSLAVLQASSLKYDRVIIKTDSQFVVKVVNSWLSKWRSNDWKKSDGKQVENTDDIKKLSQYIELVKVRLEHTYGHQKYEEGDHEQRWDELSCDERDRCGNFHSDRLSRLGVHGTKTDIEFEAECIQLLDEKQKEQIN